MIARLLKFLPPETAHGLALMAMRRRWLAPGPAGRSAVLFGRDLPSPLGLAAGFDKNGHLPGTVRDYGFGWVEVGSVTRKGCAGNPRPRLFRLPGGGLLNRMGLNGDPAMDVFARLGYSVDDCYAVNLAATPDRRDAGGPARCVTRAIDDLCYTYNLFRDSGIYTALNIGCPNTPDGRTFEDLVALKDLLSAINGIRRFYAACRPLLVKLGGGLRGSGLDGLVSACLDGGVDGFITTNTNPFAQYGDLGPGGLSGPSLFVENIERVRWLVRATGKPVIACGGIDTPDRLRAYLDAGAVACQAYSGFVAGPHAGPRFARTLADQSGWRFVGVPLMYRTTPPDC